LCTRKVYKGHSTTFDDVPNDLAKMDLRTWMMFNKDSNTTSILGKEAIHGAFKKYAAVHSLDFNSFYEAIKEVLLKIHPDNIEDGWRMLGVHNNVAVSKRMSKLGVPSYLYQSHHTEMETITSEVPPFCQYKAPTIDIGDIAVSSPLKPLNTPKKLQLTLQKLSKLNAKPRFEVPEAEPDDDIYLKSYQLPK
jgi:hypothetical protein